MPAPPRAAATADLASQLRQQEARLQAQMALPLVSADDTVIKKDELIKVQGYALAYFMRQQRRPYRPAAPAVRAEELGTIRTLAAAGVAPKDIATQLGRSRSTVTRVLRYSQGGVA